MATTVNTKGQVTIPEPLRSKYGFPPGTKVV
jgi:AbrB family looped-hinge helix DNA binding protein